MPAGKDTTEETEESGTAETVPGTLELMTVLSFTTFVSSLGRLHEALFSFTSDSADSNVRLDVKISACRDDGSSGEVETREVLILLSEFKLMFKEIKTIKENKNLMFML